LNLKAASLEYSGFSSLRLLQVAAIKEKEIIAIVNADPLDEDEVNFLVLEDGFPLFNRDMILAGGSTEPGMRIEKVSSTESVEKLKVELRMSLDFYLRRFATKAIKKIMFIAPQEYSAELDAFVRTRALTARFIDLKNYVNNPGTGFSLGFYKAYSGAVMQSVPMKFKIDLLAPTMADKGKGPAAALHFAPQDMQFNPGFLLLGALLCALAWGVGFYPQIDIKKEIEIIQQDRTAVTSINPEDPIENLEGKKQDLTSKLRNISDVIKKRFLMTAPLDGIPRMIPEGLWLRDFSLRPSGEGHSLTLQGVAYLKDNSKEIQSINKFLSDLAQDPRFKEYFPDVTLTATGKEEIFRTSVTSFVIECRGSRKK
jgi:Tfp pilus assembly protein PilN